MQPHQDFSAVRPVSSSDLYSCKMINPYCLKVKFAHSYPTLCDPMDYTIYRILQARILEWVAFPFSRGSSQPRHQTQVFCIADSLQAEPQGKPKNTGVGNHSLLQRIFLTQGSNPGLLHCRFFTIWATREAFYAYHLSMK